MSSLVFETGEPPLVWCRDCLPVTPAIDLPPVQTATNGAQAPRRVELPNADVGGTSAKISGVAGIVAPFLTVALLVQVSEPPHVSNP